MRLPTILLLATSLSLAACGGDDDDSADDGGDGGNENEVITTVTLDFAPEGGGDTVSVEWNDPDGDLGDPPTVDPILLADGATYTLSVGFENRLEDPPEIITEEVSDEADQHQIFIIGTAVNGPASDAPDAPLTHSYADEDDNGLPVGLEGTIVAAAGTGELTVILRHLPPVNDTAVKTADLAAAVADSGVDELPGSTDANVTFDVTVE
jgi:hypothetical protein